MLDEPNIVLTSAEKTAVDNNDPFGVSDDDLDIASGTPTAISDSTNPVPNGAFGTVTGS